MAEPRDERSTRALLLEILRVVESIAAQQAGTIGDPLDAVALRAIATATTGLPFSGRELFAHAAIDRDLHQALRRAGYESPRELGWLLKRVSDSRCVVHGVLVEKVDEESRDGIVWRASFAGFSEKTRSAG